MKCSRCGCQVIHENELDKVKCNNTTGRNKKIADESELLGAIKEYAQERWVTLDMWNDCIEAVSNP